MTLKRFPHCGPFVWETMVAGGSHRKGSIMRSFDLFLDGLRLLASLFGIVYALQAMG